MRAAPLLGLVVAVALAATAPARAADPQALGRAHAKRANQLSAAGRCRPAIPEFTKAYWMLRDPALLFNRAECYRKLGQSRNAVSDYRRFLTEMPTAPNRRAVEARLAALDPTYVPSPVPQVQDERPRIAEAPVPTAPAARPDEPRPTGPAGPPAGASVAATGASVPGTGASVPATGASVPATGAANAPTAVAPSLPPSAPSLPPSAPSLPPSAPSLPSSAPSLPSSAPSLPPAAPSLPERPPAAGAGPALSTGPGGEAPPQAGPGPGLPGGEPPATVATRPLHPFDDRPAPAGLGERPPPEPPASRSPVPAWVWIGAGALLVAAGAAGGWYALRPRTDVPPSSLGNYRF
jgi:hypothetical protein